MRICVCCHRNIDAQHLYFMTDIRRRRWCALCQEFALSLVDPDAAWKLVEPGPALAGSRIPRPRKPRRWIENLHVVVKKDDEHRSFFHDHTLAEYVEKRYWELNNDEMGQVNHPHTYYGLIKVPKLIASLVSRIVPRSMMKT